MRWRNVLIAASLLFAPDPGWSETSASLTTGMALRFDESKQKHPKVGTLAMPVMAPVTGYEDGPLSFEALYWTFFRSSDDPRNSKGKVILRVEVIRNNQVLWTARKKSRIKYDRYTSWECGNCTHKLHFRNKFKGNLQEGDLILFQFKFKKMPRFEIGESAELSAAVY